MAVVDRMEASSTNHLMKTATMTVMNTSPEITNTAATTITDLSVGVDSETVRTITTTSGMEVVMVAEVVQVAVLNVASLMMKSY